MIPLKEEPTLNAALCFSDEDAQQLLSCQASIAHAGNVIVASARHENLLAHYTRSMLAEINRNAASTVSIRRMPTSNDGLLERLNEHLANLDIAALQAKRVVKTREIWLYELPGPAQSDLLLMAANMVKQFKAAGVSIIVHSRQARPDSPHLQKLAERLRAKHVAFQTPDEEQCRNLAEAAKGRPEAGQINQLIRSLGVAVESGEEEELSELTASTADLSHLMQRAEKALPAARVTQQKAAKSKETEKNSRAAATNPADPINSASRRASNSRVLISSGFACLLIVAMYVSPSMDFKAGLTSAATWLQAQYSDTRKPEVTAAEQMTTALSIPEPNTEAKVAALTPTPSPAAPQPEASQSVQGLQAESAETQMNTADPEEALKSLFPVPVSRAPQPRPQIPAFESGVYVQHASFRLSQSALIWKNNNSQLPGVKVAAKGERFVTVSGPFIDRAQASQYLAEFGITATPYFIDSTVLRSQARG